MRFTDALRSRVLSAAPDLNTSTFEDRGAGIGVPPARAFDAPPAGGGWAGTGVAATLALALLALPGVTPSAAAQDALPILERAAVRYQSLDGFCADFHQDLRVTLLRQEIRSRGVICQKPPGRFEMRFTDPAGDRIVSDGSHIWIYFPSSDPGQVLQIGARGAEGRFDFHAEFLSEPGLRYRSTLEGREEVDGRMSHRILLEPRTPSPYERVRVWIDDREHLLRKLEIHEEGETIRVLDLTNLRLNPTLLADRFQFRVPEGVQVIRREGLR
jgi:outer membrane lipoprotein carrier protein